MLPHDTLWSRTIEQTRHALNCGALQPLSTKSEIVEQDGIHFLVRILTQPDLKQRAKKRQEAEKAASGNAPNPFLPYEQDLFVSDLSPTHLCLLNKYNIVDHHLLIVTRAYEAQESALTRRDFAALWECLAEFEGLVFYNSGKTAGASQHHKHLQLIPLPFAPTTPSIPIATALAQAHFPGPLGTVPNLPFKHALVRFAPNHFRTPLEAARTTFKCYELMLKAMSLHSGTAGNPPAPYNLLVTRSWMLLVPRSKEAFASIQVNALGFAGALLVRTPQQIQTLKDHGPLNLLKKVAVPAN